MKHLLTFAAIMAATNVMAYDKTPTGVSLFTKFRGSVELQWFSPSVVRVMKTGNASMPEKQSLCVTAQPQNVKLTCKESQDTLWVSSSALRVAISKTTGETHFASAAGSHLLAESNAADFKPVSDAGRSTFSVTQGFALGRDEHIYGLGILQNGKMNQRGEKRRKLSPGNTEDGIPFFQSDKGYGIFWDNYSATTIDDDGSTVALTAEVGDMADYYFIYGGNADGVVGGVRALTGAVPMAPLWSFGFYQCRERYKSQDELLSVLRRYRKDGIPVDCMIQDWQYWGGNNLWNAMDFLAESFPNPKAMMQEVHDSHAKCMISIWQSFGPHTLQYRELDSKGLLFNMGTWPQSVISHVWPPRMDYPSGVRVIDTYSAEARDIYWQHLRRLYDYGLDGWWMDSTEPDHLDWKPEDMDHQTAMGSYRSVECAFPLLSVGGVFDHQRQLDDGRRVFILTRSAFFGQQRTGANTWSGDVVSTWDMLRRQVPAGLNFSLTGNPNFNSDLGGFFSGSYNGSWQGKPGYDNPAYRELYVRWMQYGVFTPMMRSHGADTPRELFYYGRAGEPVYDALLAAIKLRYRLLPYVYSTAWQVTRHNDTFMRALFMDFAKDRKTLDIADEYMFGRSILATPVLHSQYTPEIARHDADANAGWDKNTGRVSFADMDKADFRATRQQRAYLPAGTAWYYFHSGERYDGGQEVTFTTPIGEAPFFVRAGSIIPLGPDVQYTGEKPWDDLELRVYPGADGTFTLYEDRGDGYDYEDGKYTEIDMTWRNASRTLTIAAIRGAYDGMIATRQFRATLPDGTTKTIAYSGKKVSVKL